MRGEEQLVVLVADKIAMPILSLWWQLVYKQRLQISHIHKAQRKHVGCLRSVEQKL